MDKAKRYRLIGKLTPIAGLGLYLAYGVYRAVCYSPILEHLNLKKFFIFLLPQLFASLIFLPLCLAQIAIDISRYYYGRIEFLSFIKLVGVLLCLVSPIWISGIFFWRADVNEKKKTRPIWIILLFLFFICLILYAFLSVKIIRFLDSA